MELDARKRSLYYTIKDNRFKRKDDDGTSKGGPAFYMRDALGQRWLGIIFAGCAVFAPAPGEGNFFAYVACFLIGHWGFAIIIPGTSNVLTNLVPIGAATKTMGIFTCFHQAGCFLATPVAGLLMGFLGLDPVTQGFAAYHGLMMPAAIGVIICGVLYIVVAACTKLRETDF